MKYFILLVVSLTISQTALAAREDCSFACKSIPEPNEVLADYGQSSTNALNPDKIRVHVWNLYKGRKPTFAKEYSSLYDISDLILFQESHFENGAIQKLLTPKDFSTATAHSFFTKTGVTGVGISSRAPDINSQWFRSRVKEPFVKSYKLSILSEYPLAGRSDTLLVASLHGLLRNDAQDLADQVSDVLEGAKGHTGPFLFAGDFNSRNKERMAAIDAVMKAHGLVRVAWDNEHREDKEQIDHAYVRGIKVNSAIIKTEYVGSDHPLIYLDLSIGKSASNPPL